MWDGKLSGGNLGLALLILDVFLVQIFEWVEDGGVHLLEHESDRCGAIWLDVREVLGEVELCTDGRPGVVGLELGVVCEGEKFEKRVERSERRTACAPPYCMARPQSLKRLTSWFARRKEPIWEEGSM